ncbi:hypothetical protein H0H87_003924, partial [Tephrocybe sp. NHM501043]
MNATADSNHVDQSGETALFKAANRGYLEVVKKLLENGASVDAAGKNHRWRPVKNGTADGAWLDESELTPLHVAVKNGHWEVVKYLVAKEASVDEA